MIANTLPLVTLKTILPRRPADIKRPCRVKQVIDYPLIAEKDHGYKM